jgi:hypothetical protein
MHHILRGIVQAKAQISRNNSGLYKGIPGQSRKKRTRQTLLRVLHNPLRGCVTRVLALRKHPFRESEAKRSVTRNKAKQTLRNAEQLLSGAVQRIHGKEAHTCVSRVRKRGNYPRNSLQIKKLFRSFQKL